MELSDEHMKALTEESGISEEVIESRGYRTVDKKVELESRGFSKAQRNMPGMLIPIWGPNGEIVLYQYRPDEPRIKNGKPVKYETPSGSRMVFDVHPFAREKLADPSIPLFVTEGIKKEDCLVSNNLCGVGLLGIWNWRGTNEHGGKTVVPEWQYVGLNGRQVYVVFDSDIMLKPQVHHALVRLKEFLETREADVAVIYLPHGEGGVKQGVDDFLAANHTVDDLLSLATTELKEPPSDNNNEWEDLDTQSAILIHYANQAELFHTPDGEAYATFPVEDDADAS